MSINTRNWYLQSRLDWHLGWHSFDTWLTSWSPWVNLFLPTCYVYQYICTLSQLILEWLTINWLSIECWSRCCRWSVDQVLGRVSMELSIRVTWDMDWGSIKVINRYLTMDVFSTHDPPSVNCQVSLVTHCKSVYYSTDFLYVKFSFLCLRHNLFIIFKSCMSCFISRICL